MIEEFDRLLTAAEEHGPRSAPPFSLLVYDGLRVAEVLVNLTKRLALSAGEASDVDR